MSQDPSQDFRALYHPENPAAILPRGAGQVGTAPTVSPAQFAWGMVGNGVSLAMAIIAPFLGLIFIMLTLLGAAFAVMGIVYGGGMVSSARALSDSSALRLGMFCRITGYVALAMHVLSGAAWIFTIWLGIRPLLW